MRYGFAVLLAALAMAGCGSTEMPESARQTPPGKTKVRFIDVTASAGIEFVHHNGRSGRKYLPETMGSGLAFFDYNNDGWPDLFLVNGKDWKPKPGSKTTLKLYRNNQDGTFTDVTTEAGLAIEMYGLGVAAAD